LSREAVSLVFKYLPRAYHNGSTDYEARERVHSAATIAGKAASVLLFSPSFQ
jgi:acetaldehyde dehydrogenase/alcohol dehydrogenase